jgi:hypothetical protein
MSLNTIRSTIENRIATEFAAAPVLQVAYQNVPFTPPNNASWIQTNILWGDSAYLTILTTTARGTGDGFDRRNGVLVFNIFCPRGEGPGAGLTIAQRCIDLFSRLQLQNIKFDPANGPQTIEPPAPEGFFQTQVTIAFEAFEQS